MQTNAKHTALGLVPWVSEARVARPLDGERVEVELPDGELLAVFTTVSAGMVVPGDRVVVLCNGAIDGAAAFVVGTLAKAPAFSLEMAGGARAELEHSADGAETLRVRDGQGDVVFEYDPRSGCAVASVPHGNLSLRAEHGRLELHGATGVTITSDADVRVRGAGTVALEHRSTDGSHAQRLWLDRKGVSVVASAVRAMAEKIDGRFGDGRASYRSLSVTAKTVRQTAEILETNAGRIVERAKNIFREVEELAQTRAGRARVMVREGLHLAGKRVVVGAAEDVKIDGQKIRLG